MSTWTDAVAAFKALPPEQLAFWQNLYQVYTQWDSTEISSPFLDGRPKSPFTFFYYSYFWNLFFGLPLTEPFWVDGAAGYEISPDSPVGSSSISFEAIVSQFDIATELDTWGDRAKYRVRKSYWTGIPRQRRNL